VIFIECKIYKRIQLLDIVVELQCYDLLRVGSFSVIDTLGHTLMPVNQSVSIF